MTNNLNTTAAIRTQTALALAAAATMASLLLGSGAAHADISQQNTSTQATGVSQGTSVAFGLRTQHTPTAPNTSVGR